MRRALLEGFSAVVAALMTGIVALGTQATPPPIPAGTTLRVELDATLTDKTNKTGDTFTADVREPIYV
ncbi:MAG TPA: hypothetical protein VMI06_10925, partial [Terriglobia bacterium]|nr:hypothetical protein [Terriglobia bacterium]